MTAAVACRQLTFSFGEQLAVDHVDLEIAPGEVFGLLGPNGAGKTTTIRILTTLLPCERGSAEIFGVDVGRHPMEVRRLIGYVPQQLSADSGLTGRQNLMLYARLYGLPGRVRRQVTEEVLDAMGLTESADRLVRTYSGGMVRRLELAQALVSSPKLLILDEPTTGLDPIGRTDMWERLHALRKQTGLTVLLTTHYMEEAERLCDRLAMMHLGRVRLVGTPQELKSAHGEGATLEDVFRTVAGRSLGSDEGGGYRAVRGARRAANRLG
ncbi:MAG TPA: ATP-binding cassette domain-containing protein [Acidimicrobiales bacterium]|nr:ATP-binding cassette domain-containing protein [Acidimicrobiales bacterium]